MSTYAGAYWPIAASGNSGGGGGVIVGSLPRLVISAGTDVYSPVVWSSRYAVLGVPDYTNGNWTPLPNAGTLSNFRFIICTAQDIDAGLTATIMINGVDTALSINIPAGSPAGIYSDTTHTVTVSAGDRISIHLTNASDTTTTVGDWCVSF